MEEGREGGREGGRERGREAIRGRVEHIHVTILEGCFISLTLQAQNGSTGATNSSEAE